MKRPIEPRRPLTNAEKIEIARMRFTINKATGKFVSVTEIATKFRRDNSQITKGDQ